MGVRDAMTKCRRGIMGTIFEVVVFGCLAVGLVSSAAVVGICDMLILDNDMGSIGPWRADIAGETDGCQGWDGEMEHNIGWMLWMARACSMLALIAGCVLTCVGVFRQCLCPLPKGQILTDISGT